MSAARTLHERGLSALRDGDAAGAERLLAEATALEEGDPVLWNNHGIVLAVLGRHADALVSFDRAIDIRPDYAEAYNGRGNARRALGEPSAALADFDAALRLNPDHPAFHCNRATALKELRRFDEALQSYDRAIAISPHMADAHFNRGNLLQSLKRYGDALAGYERAIALDPNSVAAHLNRGNALRAVGRLDEALAAYDRTLALAPHLLDALHNQGAVLNDLGEHAAAVASFDAAIARDGAYAEAHNSRGLALRELGRREEALASHTRAIALRADFAEAHWALGNCLLQMGDFARGWPEYEWRWQTPSLRLDPRNFTQPRWRGDGPLAGKTILLHAEQGLGDTIQFCRFANVLAGAGGRVVLEVQAPLAPLLAAAGGAAEVVVRGAPLPGFDVHCPLLSVPLALKTDLATIPMPGAYLRAPGAKVAHWREVLGAPARPRVGLAWSGNPRHRNDRSRSIDLGEMLAHLPPGADYISLQKDVRAADEAVLAASPLIRHFGERLADLADTAALASLVDVVISVDTSVAHLAGALGRPVWILLPFNPDWRWLLDRTDTPWYEAATLYRQRVSGDWRGVLERVAADLGRLGSRYE